MAMIRVQEASFASTVPFLRNQTPEGWNPMSVAKVTEITASSSKSFEDAVQLGISRATKTLENVRSAWIQDHEVEIQGGKITEYKVRMKVTFILND